MGPGPNHLCLGPITVCGADKLSELVRVEVSGSIRHLSILQGPVFLLNSWLYHFTVTILRWYALSRSYSVNLPSSFSTAHPSALEYSSRLPVSVCGTGCYSLALEVFLGGL